MRVAPFAVLLFSGATALTAVSVRADEPEAIAEITVTAQKRSETVQQVPMSITALSSATLQAAGIADFTDYATKVPNLTFSTGNSNGSANSRGIAIRGIQGADTTGLYIDDLPVPLSLDPRVVDLARIEVLRGPQGTLYGARSMGGTVRLITNSPDTHQYSVLTHLKGMSVDGGGTGYQLDATLNVPLIKDRLAIRITPYSGTDGGYFQRQYPAASPSGLGVQSNVGRNNYGGVSAALLWNVTDNLTVQPKFLYQLSSMNGLPYGDYSPSNRVQLRHFDIPEETRDRWTDAGLVINYSTSVGDITSATSVFSRSAHESEDLTEFLQSVISGIFGGTVPFAPSPAFAVEDQRVTVEELRFASKFSGPLQFVGGLYYQDSTYTAASSNNMPGYDASLGGVLGTDIMYISWSPTYQKSRAVFGEVTYAPGPSWSFTVGGRYSKDTESQGGYQYGFFVGPTVVPFSGSESETRFTPKFGIKYAPSSDVTLYATASKGYRPGGSQSAPPASVCASSYAQYNLTPEQLSTYSGDSLWNYEIGEKIRFRDPRITVNTSVFWIEWDNTRQTLTLPCTYSALINAGKARSRGAELELTAMPIDALTLTASVGYTDAKILSAGPMVAVPTPGSPIQQVAPWTSALSAEYRYPLSESLNAVARADYSYVDHSYDATVDAGTPRLRASYELLNLRLGIAKDAWEAFAFVDNVTDTRPNLGDALSLGGEDPGRPRWQTTAPRTIGIDLRMRF